MRIQCNKFPTEVPSCRFYAFPEGQERVKVHVDGNVDFAAVAQEFAAKNVTVTVDDLETAYNA